MYSIKLPGLEFWKEVATATLVFLFLILLGWGLTKVLLGGRI
jgi:hypothetical protein